MLKIAMHLRDQLPFWTLASFGALLLPACNGGEEPITSFVSDDPLGSGGDDFGDGDEGGETGGGEPGDGDSGGEGPSVLEADIVQLEGDRLYALSSYAGLTVVDVQDPDQLVALGTWETDAEPFEMYVEAGQAFVMFNDYGFWEWDAGFDEWSYNSSSRLLALDASNPAQIEVRGEFTVPGRIQDSRRVGDILYLVTLEDGWCWGCDDGQETVVTSLDISDPANPQIVEQLEFAAPSGNWDWQRSVESTAERMYVASRTWAWEGIGSLIDVIDISAGDGSLVAGAQVEVAGSVFSRWQMNEHEGVLRVISQLGWADDPVIETFTIASAQELSPLGSGHLSLPMPESLRSARFDGDRAYAITAEQIDPLFTIDLSDPANPQQIGELEIPGWVYHMEPRGDRILALGFDPAHAEGSINVSLFDVGDFANPTLRRRVHFGGDWADFAEDQDRIHKAFTILDDEQMLLVPHTGWTYEDDGCHGEYRSGVQIIDWLDDDLTLRGLVPAHGRVRRAFTHRERILSLSDTQLASFAYADRDNPLARDSLRLAVHVDDLIRAGDVWVRLARDWWTDEQLLEVVDGADPASPEPLGTLALGGEQGCGWSWIEGVVGHGDHVFVIQSAYSGFDDWESYATQTRVYAIDVGDPTAPVIADVFELDGERSWGVGQVAGVDTRANWFAHQGEHLAFLLTDGDAGSARVEVVDLSDPTALELVATLERPAGQAQGQLTVMSDSIVSWHTEPVEGLPGKVRFYFDRLDVDGQPRWADKVNVPGVVVAYDAELGRAFTVDFAITSVELAPDACYEHPKHLRYDSQAERCELIERTLERVQISGATASLTGSYDIEGDAGLRQLWATGSRVFARTDRSGWDAQHEHYEVDTELVLVDLTSDAPKVERHDGEPLGQWWWLAGAEGERAVVRSDAGEIALIDAGDPAQPDIQASSLPGYGGCYEPVIVDDAVYCPLGPYGLETVEW